MQLKKAVLVGFLGLLLWGAQPPSLDFRTHGTWTRVEVVKPADLNLQFLRARAKSFASQSPRGTRVSRLFLATSHIDGALVLAVPIGGGAVDREVALRRSYPAARITRIGESSVLEFRDEKSKIYREVLTGTDPNLLQSIISAHVNCCTLMFARQYPQIGLSPLIGCVLRHTLFAKTGLVRRMPDSFGMSSSACSALGR